jgi:hypothetical protein
MAFVIKILNSTGAAYCKRKKMRVSNMTNFYLEIYKNFFIFLFKIFWHKYG